MRHVWIVLALAGCKSCHDEPSRADADLAPVSLPPPDAAPAPLATFDACKSIFMLDVHGDVWNFTPDDPKIVRLVHASCDFGGDAEPRSIAVENGGTIWAGTWDGRIVKIRPEDGMCAQTPFAPGQWGFSAVNLTFAGDTLWASDDHGWGGDVAPSKGLARLDRTTLVLQPIGNPYQGSRIILAGTPDGKLYGQPPVSIDLLDVSKKKPAFKALTGFEAFAKGGGVPMAYFRGDIYLFHTTMPDRQADVLRFDLEKKSYTIVLPPAFEGILVSAGAAPCAGSK